MKKRRTTPEADRVYFLAFERLLKIADEIAGGRHPSRERLGEVAECDVRTVSRCLDVLRDRFNAPLDYDYSRKGYRFTNPGWRLPAAMMGEGEMLIFYTLTELLPRLGSEKEIELVRGALKKLAALLPDQVSVDLDAVAERVKFAPMGGASAPVEVLQRLTLAAVQRRTLHVEYFSAFRGERTVRDLDVLLVYRNLDDWYAVCWDHKHGEVRDFNAGRFLEIAETDRTFEPPDGWDGDAYLEKGFGMFRGGADVTVEVEFDAFEARYIRERQVHPTERRSELPGGRLRLEFDTTENALRQVVRWVMQHGEHVEVIRPPELRAMLLERLDRTLGVYIPGEP